MLLIAGLLTLAVVVAIAGYVVYDNRLVFFPAAPTSPSASPTNPLAFATHSPPPTASPTPGGSESDSSSPGDLIHRFLTIIRSPDLPYHVELSAYRLFPQAQFKDHVTISMDRAGEDYAGTIAGARLTNAKLHLIAKDGVEYMKIGRAQWVRSNQSPRDLDLLALFDSADSRDSIQDEGVENHGGIRLHHLLVLVADTSTCALSDPHADFWVRPDGQPISGVLAFSCTNSSAHGRFDWSKFGEPVVINAPM